jgi:hypothetical protein
LALVTALIVGVVAVWQVGPAVVRRLADVGPVPSGGAPGAAPATSSARPAPGDERSPAVLARVIVKPGTGLLEGWQDTSSLGQGLTPDSILTNYCNRPVPEVTGTESAGSDAMWLALSDLQPKGEALREFWQGLGRVGVRPAQKVLTQIRASVEACHSYQVSPQPNPLHDLDAYTIRLDPAVQIGDESFGVSYHDVNTSDAGRDDTYAYQLIFRVGDVLAFTSGSTSIELSSQDLARIRNVALEEVRRLHQP